jgi:hypothetical protein
VVSEAQRPTVFVQGGGGICQPHPWVGLQTQ